MSSMQLHNLRPAKGAVKPNRRIGRGEGSGSGVTAGKGNKGQQSRTGYQKKTGHEGGQMPIQRRLPKFGFTSRMARHYAEVRLHEIASVEGGNVNVEALIAAGLVPLQTKTVKIILSGKVNAPCTVTGCRVTKGAKAAIEAAGGSVTEPAAPAAS